MTTRRSSLSRVSVTVGAVVLALLTASCATTGRAQASSGPAGAAATAPAASTGSPTSEVGEKPTTVVPRPLDPLAGRYVPVKRNGRTPKPTISAAPSSFNAPVHYTDGTTLLVTSIKQAVVTGQGPGIFPGRPITSVGLTLTNGSSKPINVSQVVVTASYGSPSRLAPPVYDNSSHDFGGMAAPGASVNATYVFSIPTAQLGSVVMIVDFDGVHVSATFAGPAR